MNDENSSPALQAYFLDRLPFERVLELQRRLVEERRDRDDGQMALLLCEHPNLITVGRGGSSADIRRDSPTLRSREIEVVYVNRGGGSMFHGPGQLAIYPIVPLDWHGFSVGEYLDRFQAGLVDTLNDLHIHVHTVQGKHGIWGRTGQLAMFGVAVRHWVTYYGAYLNVDPPLGLFRLIESAPDESPPISSLLAERCGSVRMPLVRAALVNRLSAAFGCDRYHLYTGHPYLRASKERD